MKTRVQDLGNSCVRIVQNAGTVQMNPSYGYSRQELAESARDVSEKVPRCHVEHFNVAFGVKNFILKNWPFLLIQLSSSALEANKLSPLANYRL